MPTPHFSTSYLQQLTWCCKRWHASKPRPVSPLWCKFATKKKVSRFDFATRNLSAQGWPCLLRSKRGSRFEVLLQQLYKPVIRYHSGRDCANYNNLSYRIRNRERQYRPEDVNRQSSIAVRVWKLKLLDRISNSYLGILLKFPKGQPQSLYWRSSPPSPSSISCKFQASKRIW